ncbi:MAG: hypothetical protein HOL98_06640 [Gammaproteobacteria bacterium]|nr:hypothetical protein [Gammaproteobacteria bacterium]MBT5603215.1 hypothetical protein [Gammaproteobacteria bacterium]MBT6244020.1 hypothetical protein [Gammaproteobacteria bacterium]
MAPFYTVTNPHSYVGRGKTTHLGASIPLMTGAKMAMPERTCAAFLGDGFRYVRSCYGNRCTRGTANYRLGHSHLAGRTRYCTKQYLPG